MRFSLIAAALVLVVAVPASADAQRMGGSGLSAGNGAQSRGSHGRDGLRVIPDFERPRARDDRRDGYRRGYPIGFGYYGGYGGRDIDRSWQPDSYNDWWHERPWRAYPAWVSRNQNCERMYWSGGGWRC